MFPDSLPMRLVLLGVFALFDAIPLISLLVTATWLSTRPEPSLSALTPFYATSHPILVWVLDVWAKLELAWWAYDFWDRWRVRRKFDKMRTFGGVPEEEKWPLLKAMCCTDVDAWKVWGGYFHDASSIAPAGMNDPAVRLQPEDIGRENVAEALGHYFFNKNVDELSASELAQVEIMVQHVEASIRASRGRDPNFKFRPGRRNNVAVFKVYAKPLRLLHRPLLFYVHTILFSQIANLALALRGFRHFGPKEPFFAWYWMRGRHPHGLQGFTEDDRNVAKKLPYWFWPGRKGHQKDTPFVFFHGMSGSYGPTPFLLALAWITGRPILLPEYPITFMRSASPRTIVARLETVAAIKFSLRARGFDRCVSIGHSLGTAPAAWLLHDCPEVVASTVFVDPATILLSHPDATRNFYRLKCKTAAEIFFRYFAAEKGIGLFMSRFVLWNEAIVFGPHDEIKPDFPLVPTSGLPEPLPSETEAAQFGAKSPPRPPRLDPKATVVFSSELDGICPALLIGEYCKRMGIPFEMMWGFEHARVLFSPFWMRRIAETCEAMGEAADERTRHDRGSTSTESVTGII